MIMLTVVKDPLSSSPASAVESNRRHDDHRRQPYRSRDNYGLSMPFAVHKIRYHSLQTGQRLCFADGSGQLTGGGAARGCLLI
jgi:hypothetical protein